MTSEERAEALRVTFGTRGWQEILKPALAAAVEGAVGQWASGQRNTGEESVTDNELKQRVFALQWVLEWEKRKDVLLEQLAQLERMKEKMIPATEGGSPYDAAPLPKTL